VDDVSFIEVLLLLLSEKLYMPSAHVRRGLLLPLSRDPFRLCALREWRGNFLFSGLSGSTNRHGNCFPFWASNYSKSQVFPINYLSEQIDLTCSALRCIIVDFPCTYLGVPFSTKRLPKTTMQPLVFQC
jgi:hypothetical protein